MRSTRTSARAGSAAQALADSMRQYTGDHLAARVVDGVTYIAGELAEVQIALLRVLRAHPIDCAHPIYAAPGDHLDAICAADQAWGGDRRTREARVQRALERAQK